MADWGAGTYVPHEPMALRNEDLPGVKESSRAVLIAYSRLPLPRPTLSLFSQGKVSYSTLSKAAVKCGYQAKLAAHDEANAAVRDVADAADTTFVGKVRAALGLLRRRPLRSPRPCPWNLSSWRPRAL